MNSRTFGILAVIAALLAGIAIVSQRGSDTASIAGATAGELFVPGLADALDAIDSIEIMGAGDARLVRLERSGTGWLVAEQDGYPADASSVNALLIALTEARIVEEKTADPNFHSRLGVEDVAAAEATGLEVTLAASDGARFELIFGDAYGEDERYARQSVSAQSVLIDRDPEIARDPADWLTSEIVAIPESRVQSVAITHADGERLVIRKDAREQTDFTVEAVPEGRELQYPGIANVTGSVLQNLALEAVSRQPEAGGEILATTEIRTFDGLVVTVTATAADEADSEADAEADADEVNVEPWLSFSARFDAEQALAFATEPIGDIANAEPADAVDANEAETAEVAGDDTAGVTATASDAIAEAEAIAARLAGWRYRIPAYQYSQLTRRMEDLLRAPPAE